MRLVAIYTLWDYGLLEKSYNNIRPCVDGVIFIHQHLSNFGKENDEERPDLKGDWIEYVPALNWNAKRNERNKHIQAINYAREQGYTHFILLAHDHFYKQNEVEAAKQLVIEKGYDTTATKMFTYFKEPTWQLTPVENYYMPFICEITKDMTVRHGLFPVYVDPAVCFFPVRKFYAFKENECMMHHYTMIRKDIRKKFENAASKVNWVGKTEQLISEFETYNIDVPTPLEYFGGRTLIKAYNIFNI